MHRAISRRGWLTGATVAVVAVVAALALGTASTPANASAHPAPGAQPAHAMQQHSRVVRVGAARFEVLTPTLIRLEYAADRKFENRPTFNVVRRDLPVPQFHARSRHGVLTIRTSKLTLRYREGSGPFTRHNVAVRLTSGGQSVSAHPSWPRPTGFCRYDTACQAEDGRLNAGESVNYDHPGYTGRGFAADYGQVSATDSWTVTGVPTDGAYALQVRYANGNSDPTTLSTTVDGAPAGTVSFPSTGSWDTWSTTSVPVQLHAGTNSIETACAADDGCNVNLDSVAATNTGAAYPTRTTTPAPPVGQPGQLGGWLRGLDAYTNQAGEDITDYQLHPGILNRRGWSLLDDSRTAIRTTGSWVRPRPSHAGAYQDGYFFGYGRDYKQALRDLHAITGPADLLPKWAFGVWFSEYYPFTTNDYETQLIPAFRRNRVPLDTLVADTDWKSPQQWDGWNWNPNLFPNPGAFLSWAKQQHLHVTLNVHAGIDGSDPKFDQAQQTAGGSLQPAAQCFSPTCYRFNWSNRKQAAAWFGLHQPFERQGVRQWWLDWCCTDSYVGMPGLTPDSWINELYARDRNADGLRGFILARIGASFEDYRGAPQSGPWGEHRSTVHFTGDTDPTWATLRFEAQFSQDEASIGLPYVSDDIGSFKGKHLPDDMYARWVQLGTFQPILRLHSDHGDRLPWQYGAGRQAAADALRLREALVPYTYTLGWQAHHTGLPITRPLYLDYPARPQAYSHPGEYLYGPHVLVAPVTSPGTVASRTVWFPPGRWIDYYTGATFTGPTSATLSVPLDRMPVFVKAGGIVPERPGQQYVDARPRAPLTVKAFAGGNGRFALYEDAGDGFGYRTGHHTQTVLRYHEIGRHRSELAISRARGSYVGESARRAYRVELVDVSAPKAVRVDGSRLARRPAGGSGPGWWYDADTATLHAQTARLAASRPHTVTQVGGRAVNRREAAAVALTIKPPTPTTLDSGASTTVQTSVANDGPGSIRDGQVTLSAPRGWTVSPAGAQSIGTLTDGDTATQTWTVTAPDSGSASTAALRATVSYADAATGAPTTVRTYQGPPSNLPPTISDLSPSSAGAGDKVTIHGTNFGATQGDPSTNYVFFVDGDTSWGAPFDGATFHVDSWSDKAITFTVPEPSGPNGIWHVTPGSTAQVSVTTAAGGSNSVPLKITG